MGYNFVADTTSLSSFV